MPSCCTSDGCSNPASPIALNSSCLSWKSLKLEPWVAEVLLSSLGGLTFLSQLALLAGLVPLHLSALLVVLGLRVVRGLLFRISHL